MTRFKVGDRVRRIGPAKSQYVGELGTVENTDDQMRSEWISVRWDDDTLTNPGIHNLELVRETITADQIKVTDEALGMNPRMKPTETVEAQHRSVLMEAEELVNGARRKHYGHPRENFSRICDLWNAYLRGRPCGQAGEITPEDHALMMIMLKLARLQETPHHRDSEVDVAGYIATYEMLGEKS